MLTTGQIILRLILSLIFGIVFGLFLKKEKEKVSDLKIYPIFSLVSCSISLFTMELLLKIYSRVEITLLPAVLIIGLFFVARALTGKDDDTNETILKTVYWLLMIVVGSCLGFGFYRLSIFSSLLALIFVTFSLPLENFLKKIWPPK